MCVFLGFQCSYCGKQLSNKYNLKIHIRDKHEKQGWEYFVCTYCNKAAKSKSALRKHMYDYHKDASAGSF